MADTQAARPSRTPKVHGEKLAHAVHAASGERPELPVPPVVSPGESSTADTGVKKKRAKAAPVAEGALLDETLAPRPAEAVADSGGEAPPTRELAATEGTASAEDAPSAEPPRRTKRAAPRAGGEDASEGAGAPARPSGPPLEPQYLVLTGGSPYLRAIGFIQRAGGEPLPGFESVTVSKLSAPPLPTEPGTYEFRFRVRNGTGDFKLAQRTDKGATRNAQGYDVDPKDALQTWRFTLP